MQFQITMTLTAHDDDFPREVASILRYIADNVEKTTPNENMEGDCEDLQGNRVGEFRFTHEET